MNYRLTRILSTYVLGKVRALTEIFFRRRNLDISIKERSITRTQSLTPQPETS